MPQSVQMPCCIEAPPAYLAKARYAVEMLLQPLGIDPAWTAREHLEQGLYYGADPPGGEGRIVSFVLDAASPRFFDTPGTVSSDAVHWVSWDGEAWPVPLGAPRPDLIASAFFWLSGWQEVAQPVRDPHGRFPLGASLQHDLGIVRRPPVDAYREMLAERLEAAGLPVRRRRWGEATWVLCPTHDIDYLRKWRPGILYREAVPYFLNNQLSRPLAPRLRRLGAVVKDAVFLEDPQRMAFERMQAEVARRGGTATYFLKMGAHGPRDVRYDPEDPYLADRVAHLRADGFEIGLHPSYHAHTHGAYLRSERDQLKTLTGAMPHSVRQHYLRYELPTTPRLHAAAGFRIDSTLGFAEHEGFRHGTCLPFRIFDVAQNAPLDVWEMPLSVMESALFNRRHLAPEAARTVTREILATCQRFGGAAVMLWHNVLWDERDYPGWGQHFTETLDAAVEQGAHLCSLQEALRRWDPRIVE